MIVEAALALSLAAKPPPPRDFLAVDAQRHRVTIALIASYDGENGGYNFDGYSRDLMWTVPRGWTVRVVCKNRGPLRHSCAVVQGADSTKLAFPGAATPQPRIGLEGGHTARFTFRASRKGVYRLVSLVPGDENARVWDVLKITRGGRPSVVDLRVATRRGLALLVAAEPDDPHPPDGDHDDEGEWQRPAEDRAGEKRGGHVHESSSGRGSAAGASAPPGSSQR